MRVKHNTKVLAEVRRLIREANKWKDVDGNSPEFYNSDDYKKAKKLSKDDVIDRECESKRVFYYVRSERAIETIAKKIIAIAGKYNFKEDVKNEPKEKKAKK